MAEALRGAESLTPALSEDFPELAQIVGLRNRIAHSYDDLNYVTLWEIATVEVPSLLPRIDALLDDFEFPGDEDDIS